MNTFDAQGNYVDENGRIVKRAFNNACYEIDKETGMIIKRTTEYTKNDLSKFSEAERQKVS